MQALAVGQRQNQQVVADLWAEAGQEVGHDFPLDPFRLLSTLEHSNVKPSFNQSAVREESHDVKGQW